MSALSKAIGDIEDILDELRDLDDPEQEEEVAVESTLVKPGDGGGWSPDQFIALPGKRAWDIIDAHPTGYVDASQPWRHKDEGAGHRIAMDSPDNLPAFLHNVKKKDIVNPVCIDTPAIPVAFADIDQILFRYHHWIEGYSGQPGKWIGMQCGQGWVARGNVKSKDAKTYGKGGCSATTMHPKKGDKNGLRILCSYEEQESVFGHCVGKSPIMPRKRWVTVDVVISRDGYEAFMDGESVAKRKKITPNKNWDHMLAAWYRTRLMHGGIPKKLAAYQAYREFFGGFFVGIPG